MSVGYPVAIISSVKIAELHDWQFDPAQAMILQRQLAARVSRSDKVTEPRFIAGVDIAVGKAGGMAAGAVVVLSYPELELVETRVAHGKLDFPYILGLLSFREAPLTLAACEQLTVVPDVVIVDGHGIAHPRRMGLACHLGLFLDIPTIGCAKSLLCGRHGKPDEQPGSTAEIVDKGETIGAALYTRLGTKPVYVSIGHKIDLQNTVRWVLACCRVIVCRNRPGWHIRRLAANWSKREAM
ncbi:deoxyribonuclease V [Chloroflexota bacterium]